MAEWSMAVALKTGPLARLKPVMFDGLIAIRIHRIPPQFARSDSLRTYLNEPIA